MNKKRYELLKVRAGNVPLMVARVESQFNGPASYSVSRDPAGMRKCDIKEAAMLVVLAHLEFPISIDPKVRANEGADVFVDFFCGPWRNDVLAIRIHVPLPVGLSASHMGQFSAFYSKGLRILKKRQKQFVMRRKAVRSILMPQSQTSIYLLPTGFREREVTGATRVNASKNVARNALN